MTGWTQDSAGPATAISTTGGGYPGPHAGTYYFVAADTAANAASSTFSQTINIPSTFNTDIDAAIVAVELSAYQTNSSASGDYGSLLLECIDSGSTVLSSFTATNISTATSWVFRSAKIAVPANTRKLRIGSVNTRTVGTTLDSYWDDFALTLNTNTTLYSNAGGSGNRSGSITVTATNITAGAGAPSALVDGSQADSYWWTVVTGNGTQYLTFDFGSSKVIDAFRWYQDVQSTHGTWRFEGSPDNSAWTQIGSDFTLTGGPASGTVLLEPGGIYYFSNTTGYRYYRIRHMSGNRSNGPFLREIEFRIA